MKAESDGKIREIATNFDRRKIGVQRAATWGCGMLKGSLKTDFAGHADYHVCKICDK